MANRFLETNYYKSPFVRSLKGAIKGLYSFIICDCTPSGIWGRDMEAASMYIGFKVTEEDFDENFVKTGKAVHISGGKFFFPDFIEHQYPKGLQENNAAHKNIIFELKKFDLLDEKNSIKTKKKSSTYIDPLQPLYRGQGYSNGNGVGNGQGKGNGIIAPLDCEKVSMPFGEDFKKMWVEWKKYKITQHEFAYKSEGSEQAALHELVTIAFGKEEISIAIIKQSMANGWKGLFEIKKSNNGTGKQATGKDVNVQSAFDAIDRHYAKNGKG